MVRAVLDGVRVVEWSTYQAGPAAGAMLADLGAEVLKIEEPVRGDGLRSFRTSAGGIPVHLSNGCNVLFEENNRNKKSFACDLKHPEGLQAVYQLIKHSDVFLTNFRPHVVQRIGLDYDTLRSSNPRLVFASAAGLGHRGPDAGLGTIDYVAQARSGVMVSAESLSGTMEPVILPPGIGDRITATYLAYGVVCALLARERFGAGQEVRTNQLSSYVSAAAFSVMLAISQHRAFGRDRKTAPNPLVNFYRCRDDTWIMLGCQEDFYWDRFCLAIEATFLLTDPRFASAEARARNSPDLVKILDDIFETRPFDEWAGVLSSWDFRYSRVNSFMELPQDEQAVANGAIVDWNNPKWGPMKFVGFPVEFDDTPLQLRTPAPELGEHTEEILRQVCGYAPGDVERLKRSGIIRCAEPVPGSQAE